MVLNRGVKVKEYYNVNDVKQIIGCGKSYAYEIISKLKERFSKEYPDAIVINGKIPIWYFEKVMMSKERSD